MTPLCDSETSCPGSTWVLCPPPSPSLCNTGLFIYLSLSLSLSVSLQVARLSSPSPRMWRWSRAARLTWPAEWIIMITPPSSGQIQHNRPSSSGTRKVSVGMRRHKSVWCSKLVEEPEWVTGSGREEMCCVRMSLGSRLMSLNIHVCPSLSLSLSDGPATQTKQSILRFIASTSALQ